MMNITQMVSKQVVRYFLLINFVINVWSCTLLDGYLKGSSTSVKQHTPTIIFDCSILNYNTDTLVILALKDASIVEKRKFQELRFCLKNTNEKLTILSARNHHVSEFLCFAKIYGKISKRIKKVYTQLGDMQTFTIYLKRLTVDKNKLNSYKILKDANYEDIHNRNQQVINQRKILFIIRNLNEFESAIYEEMIDNIFEPYNPDEDYSS